MKPLHHYLMESAKKYTYRIKIAGDFTADQQKSVKRGLEQFDIETFGEVKKTPIQQSPAGFPGIKNEPVNSVVVTLNYPASTEQITRIVYDAGVEINRIIVLDPAYDDTMAVDINGIDEGDAPKLETPYPDQTKEQKDASKKYSDSFKDIVKNAASTDFEIAGNEKVKAVDYNELTGIGALSPMTKTTRGKVEDLGR